MISQVHYLLKTGAEEKVSSCAQHQGQGEEEGEEDASQQAVGPGSLNRSNTN